MTRWASLVRVGSTIAGVVSVHTVVNAALLRRSTTADRLVGANRSAERVTVCIPMRNEEANIGECLRSVLASTGLEQFEVLVLDDGSTDASVLEAERVAVFGDVSPRASVVKTRIIPGGNAVLPGGWLGKAWACERLRREATGSVLVFLDADVRVAPEALAVSTRMLRRLGWDLLSPYPRQVAITAVERLVQPLLQWLWLSFLPLRLAERSRPVSMAAANGQFMVLDAAALASVGGFASVRGDVLDDVALLRAFKRAGRRGGVVDGTTLASCRMYTDGSALADGYTKNLWAATGSIPGAVGLGGLLALAYLVPPAGMLHRSTRVVGTVGYLTGVVGRVISAQTTGGRVADSAAHPASIAVLLGLIGRSWSAKLRGQVSWKGRSVA